MTFFSTSLKRALSGIEATAHELSLLQHSSVLRSLGSGTQLHAQSVSSEDPSLLILTQGSLCVRRSLEGARAMGHDDEDGVRIVAGDLPVLVPPPTEKLLIVAETEIALIEFAACDCDFLLTSCRAFRALVFAAANAGVAQLSEKRTESEGPDPLSTCKAFPQRFLH